MASKRWFSSRVIWVLGFVVATICLLRVFAVTAHAYEDVEVYSSMESKSDDGDPGDGDVDRAEIRLTRPDEANKRVADYGYEMVPGAERLAHNNDTLTVPKKVGRAIASDSEGTAKLRKRIYSTKDIDLGENVETARPAGSRLAAAKRSAPAPVAEVEAPRAVRYQDAPQSVAAADDVETPRHAVQRSYGIASEPKFEPKIDSPVPRSVLAGVQEVSIIVSDYGYFPNKIFVTQNVPVKLYLTSPSKTTLCFIVDAWGVKKGISPGKIEEVTFTPDQPGEYRFYCPVKSIEGKIAVREASTAEPSTRGLASSAASGLSPEVMEPKRPTASANEPRNAPELRAVIEE